MPPRLTIFGTVAVSTTRIHGVHFIDAEVFGGCAISSGVIALAIAIMMFVFVLRDSALFRRPSGNRSSSG